MSCISLIAHNTTMATTQVTRAASRRIRWPRLEGQKAERTPVRMNWVVVTDENGNRRLRSIWHANREG